MKIKHFAASNNIQDRGDIATLKSHFDGDYIKFIYAWGMREPKLVCAFYEGGFELAKITPCKYKFLPTRLVKHMKPHMLETWNVAIVREVAHGLKQAMETPNMHSYKRAIKCARRLPGVGLYSSEHLYRTCCIMNNIKHPSNTFVKMGSGANHTKYDTLRSFGIFDIPTLNQKLFYWDPHFYDRTVYMDAGELAYILCMMK